MRSDNGYSGGYSERNLCQFPIVQRYVPLAALSV
jgi:hypothetical protein